MKKLAIRLALLAGGFSAAVAHADEFRGPTEPAKPVAGKKVTIVTCFSILNGCVAPARGFQEAAEKLGWKVTVLDGKGNAKDQNAAMLDAVSSGADAIVNLAIDAKLVQLGLNAAKNAGIVAVSGSNGIDTPNPVYTPEEGALTYAFDVGPDYAAVGRKTAEWIIEDSNGTADIAVFSAKEFPSVTAFQAGLLEGLKKCEKCKVSEPQHFASSQVGDVLGQRTVAYVQSNPDTQYIFSPFDSAAAVQVKALQLANLGDQVKVVSVLGDQQNQNFIRTGRTQVASAAYDNRYMGFAIADQLVRHFNNQPLFEPHGENMPFMVIDKDNLPAPGKDWQADFDYAQKFYDLWK